MYLIYDNGRERIAGTNDFYDTVIELDQHELDELRKIFECRTKTAPPVLWTKMFEMRERLREIDSKLVLSPTEWLEMIQFLEWRKRDKPSAFRKLDKSIHDKLKANPPKLKSGYKIIREE